MQRDRLTSDFSDVLRNFQVIQRTAAQKEKESVLRARAASHTKQEDGPSALIDLDGTLSYQQHQRPQQQTQSQIQMEEEVDVEELREREKSIRKIESDIVDVNQIFKDLATMVHAQGEVIDSIEANVESATIQVSEGASQIAKAREYQVLCPFFFLITSSPSLSSVGLDSGSKKDHVFDRTVSSWCCDHRPRYLLRFLMRCVTGSLLTLVAVSHSLTS